MAYIRSLLFPVFAVTATFLTLWFLHLPVPEISSSPEQVQNEAETGGYRLIDVDALSAMYRSKRDEILLVDTRQDWEHRAGHIEGSLSFPMEPTRWARWRKKAALTAFLGPDKDKSIVFY